MEIPYDIIKFPIRTEKGTGLQKKNKYLFGVAIYSNKVQIRKAIEDIYKVKVSKVNTVMMRGKYRRVRFKEGKRPDWKKAIITLKQGEKIEVAT